MEQSISIGTVVHLYSKGPALTRDRSVPRPNRYMQLHCQDFLRLSEGDHAEPQSWNVVTSPLQTVALLVTSCKTATVEVSSG